MNDEKYFKAMFVIAIMLSISNFLDAATTYYALNLPNLYESNPAMDILIHHYGIWAFVIKILLITMILPISPMPYHYLIKNITKHYFFRFMFMVIYIAITCFLTYCWINNIVLIGGSV